MLSCLASGIAGLLFVTLYIYSKKTGISKQTKTILEIWALVAIGCSGLMVCSALTTGI